MNRNEKSEATHTPVDYAPMNHLELMLVPPVLTQKLVTRPRSLHL